ncbi:MAG TPA: F0F1 ATP synthase subunit epsilon [Bryobacterales bacterium]|nr:F0F1 ATP synthase subunit epsilon [Bryobacterales bacterium]
MAEPFLLEIVTPERLLIREEVTEAQIPALSGEIGVRREHAPLIAELGIGVLSYAGEGRARHLSVSGGLVEVLRDHVRVLANTAEHADQIDVKRAEEAQRRASRRLEAPHLGLDVARALNALQRAQTRLKAAAMLK